MDIYSLARTFLFQLDAETAHDVTLQSLKLAQKAGALHLYPVPIVCQPRQVMGITFPNAVGLAAGLDKNGAAINAMANKMGANFFKLVDRRLLEALCRASLPDLPWSMHIVRERGKKKLIFFSF